MQVLMAWPIRRPTHSRPAPTWSTPSSRRTSDPVAAATRPPGEGKRGRQLRRVGTTLEAADLRRDATGATIVEERTATCKSQSVDAAISIAPPAGILRWPTLCTRRDPPIPRPPAAGAAAGGGESSRSPAARWRKRGGRKKCSFHCRWGKGSGPTRSVLSKENRN